MSATKFTLENGLYQIDKDADDKRYYGDNIVDELTFEGVATAAIATDAEAFALGLEPLSATCVGVSLRNNTFFAQGSFVIALIQGGDSAAGVAGNYVRFRIPLTTGEQIDRTLNFNIKDR